ncbi:hypothetical protein GQ602_005524 [Ophiocordyceps camponoti-floridani]|uniref:Secreted protein n=1 Tax=Ophiocordyceps camponoti-floridani TaxID=2030778 RepID=A0A8H4Q3H9_9HYPO|nr:hypothetical protein GQ602_005524 [Ophiocordyceps camponoti-floridani]
MGQPPRGARSALLLALSLALVLWTMTCTAAPQLSSPRPMLRDKPKKSASFGSIGSKMLKDTGRGLTWHSFTPAQLGSSRKTHPVDGFPNPVSAGNRRVRPELPVKSNRKPASGAEPHKQNPAFTGSGTESLTSSNMAWMKGKQVFEWPAKSKGGQLSSTPRKKVVEGLSKPEKQHPDVVRPVKHVQDAAAAMPVKETLLIKFPERLRDALPRVGNHEARKKVAEGGSLSPKGSREVKSLNGGRAGKKSKDTEITVAHEEKHAETRHHQQAAKMDISPAEAEILKTANDPSQRMEQSAIAAGKLAAESTESQSTTGNPYKTIKRFGQSLSEAEVRSKDFPGKRPESPTGGDRRDGFDLMQLSGRVQPRQGLRAERPNARTAADPREFLKPKTGKRRTSHPTLRQLDKARSRHD